MLAHESPQSSRPALVRIPAGRFEMGDGPEVGAAQSRPAHEVELDAFEIAPRCVTAAEFHQFIIDPDARFDDFWCDFMNPCFIVRTTTGYALRPGAGDYPMIQVSFVGAVAYCNWLSSVHGLEPVYELATLAADLSRDGFRLPTEAEWERACIGPDGHYGRTLGAATQLNGRELDTAFAPLRAAHRRIGGFGLHPESPVPVGRLAPNGFGLHEMLGNVNEWCHDRYAAYEAGPARNPTGPTRGSFRVIRGGSFVDGCDKLRATHRHGIHYHAKCMIDGFRIARNA